MNFENAQIHIIIHYAYNAFSFFFVYEHCENKKFAYAYTRIYIIYYI